jgi:hypothetical protein
VKLYEKAAVGHRDLMDPNLQLVAVDESTLTNCSSTMNNARLPGTGGRYGADLRFTPSAIVYQVAIADSMQTYAGATVSNLNGDIDGDIDVVLHPWPQQSPFSGGTSAGANAVQVRASVMNFRGWTLDEKRGVFSVMNALSFLRPATTGVVRDFVSLYVQALTGLGINATFF